MGPQRLNFAHHPVRYRYPHIPVVASVQRISWEVFDHRFLVFYAERFGYERFLCLEPLFFLPTHSQAETIHFRFDVTTERQIDKVPHYLYTEYRLFGVQTL